MTARSWLAACAAALPLVACSATTPGPQVMDAAFPEPTPIEAPPASLLVAPTSSSAPVGFSPVPAVGALNGGTAPSVQLKVIEGMSREQANLLTQEAAERVKDCAGAGSAVTVSIFNVGTHSDIKVDTHTVADAIGEQCVIDALSTIQIRDPFAGGTQDLLRTADRYSAQFVVAW